MCCFRGGQIFSKPNPCRTALSARSARRSDDGLVMVDAWWIQSIAQTVEWLPRAWNTWTKRGFSMVRICFNRDDVFNISTFEIEPNTSKMSVELLVTFQKHDRLMVDGGGCGWSMLNISCCKLQDAEHSSRKLQKKTYLLSCDNYIVMLTGNNMWWFLWETSVTSPKNINL